HQPIVDSTAILIVTIRHWLSPRSHTRSPIGFPCGQLSAISLRMKQRERLGLPRSMSITRSVRSRLDAGGLIVHDAGRTSLRTGHVPFGHSVSASYAVWAMTARVQRFSYLDRAISPSSRPPRG